MIEILLCVFLLEKSFELVGWDNHYAGCLQEGSFPQEAVAEHCMS